MTSGEPAIEQINRKFPGSEAFTRNAMCCAKLAGTIVIAAAPSTCELREQIRGYSGQDRTVPDVL